MLWTCTKKTLHEVWSDARTRNSYSCLFGIVIATTVFGNLFVLVFDKWTCLCSNRVSTAFTYCDDLKFVLQWILDRLTADFCCKCRSASGECFIHVGSCDWRFTSKVMWLEISIVRPCDWRFTSKAIRLEISIVRPCDWRFTNLSLIRGVVANYLASQVRDPGIDSHQHQKDSWRIWRHLRNDIVFSYNLRCLLIFLHGRSLTYRVASLRARPVGRISYNLYFDCKHVQYVTCDFNKRIYCILFHEAMR